MLPSTNLQSLVGATLYGPGEVKLGRIAQIYVDATDGHPTWAEVHVGAVMRHSTLVPLDEAVWEHDDVQVPFGKGLVKDAPRIESGRGLDPELEQELTRHYSSR
ncbi:PRC-barrel domain-containing protein [Herbiconiux sp. P15]|uniref:PRC-barrel domain-containing protein n=1 Tax=Herbiconiux liukaitaii TaxID=3342799 RepID=UPI0035B746CF